MTHHFDTIRRIAYSGSGPIARRWVKADCAMVGGSLAALLVHGWRFRRRTVHVCGVSADGQADGYLREEGARGPDRDCHSAPGFEPPFPSARGPAVPPQGARQADR